MFCVSSEDRPVLRTRITTCCCSRARRFHLATSEDQLADIIAECQRLKAGQRRDEGRFD